MKLCLICHSENDAAAATCAACGEASWATNSAGVGYQPEHAARPPVNARPSSAPVTRPVTLRPPPPVATPPGPPMPNYTIAPLPPDEAEADASEETSADAPKSKRSKRP